MEARVILEPYFEELQERFAEAGLKRVLRTKLRCVSHVHDAPRHFAGCMEDGTIIYAAPQMIELPEETVMGILAHELGHAADFLYPGEFVLRGERIVRMEADRHRMKGWRRRDADTVELSADFIAEAVLEVPIGYRGPCQLQSIGAGGVRRPLGLR